MNRTTCTEVTVEPTNVLNGVEYAFANKVLKKFNNGEISEEESSTMLNTMVDNKNLVTVVMDRIHGNSKCRKWHKDDFMNEVKPETSMISIVRNNVKETTSETPETESDDSNDTLFRPMSEVIQNLGETIRKVYNF